MRLLLPVVGLCLVAGSAFAKDVQPASAETREQTGIVEWRSEQTAKGATLRGVNETGVAVLEATSVANNVELCTSHKTSACRSFDLAAITETDNPYYAPNDFDAALLSALHRDFTNGGPQLFFNCPTNCYRSASADNTIVALAASTGIFFGPLGGVFVGAGAALMTNQYIGNIKLNCTRMNCGPFMRP